MNQSSPPGFRPTKYQEKVQRLAAEMAKLEKEWTEKNLRALLPQWVLYTMDRWNLAWPCKVYVRLRRIELAKHAGKEGATIQILMGGQIVKQGRSRVEGNTWKITEVPHGS